MIIEHTNCTHHIKPLFNVKGIDFYAGAEVDWDYFVEEHPGTIGVTLNLRGFAAKPKAIVDKVFVDGVEVYDHPVLNLNKPATTSEVIVFDWPDGGVSRAGKSFWLSLLDYLIARKTPVFVHCQGGHGRTGTALAILAALGGALPKDTDPVAWVRKEYCTRAVETASQITYIETITGLPVTEAPRPYMTGYAPRQYGTQYGGYQGGYTPPAPSTYQHSQPPPEPGTTAASTKATKRERKAFYKQAMESLKDAYLHATANSVDTVIELVTDEKIYWKQVPENGYYNSCGCFLGRNFDDAKQLATRLADDMCDFIKENDYANDAPANT